MEEHCNSLTVTRVTLVIYSPFPWTLQTSVANCFQNTFVLVRSHGQRALWLVTSCHLCLLMLKAKLAATTEFVIIFTCFVIVWWRWCTHMHPNKKGKWIVALWRCLQALNFYDCKEVWSRYEWHFQKYVGCSLIGLGLYWEKLPLDLSHHKSSPMCAFCFHSSPPCFRTSTKQFGQHLL